MNATAICSQRKQGIALVVVLGFLSALILLAVAFAIIMRTERLASRNYNDQVRTRQLIHAALARIIADHVRTNMAGKVYPAWEAIYSKYDGRLGPDFIEEDGKPYIPYALSNAAYMANLAEWRPIRDPDPQDNKFYGEYAFLVINNSGLLDANWVANESRKRGVNPGEIRAVTNVLAELATNTLATCRNTIKRFESIVELYQLGLPGAGLGGFARERPSYYVDNFHVYSRFPRGYAVWDPTVPPLGGWVANTNVFYVPTDYAWNASQITACRDALADLSPNPIPDPAAFVNAMRDYMNDQDYQPAGATPDEQFKRFSANAVPMINEIMVTNAFKLKQVGTNIFLQHQISLITETWYPFPSNALPAFTVAYIGTPQVILWPYTPNAVLSPVGTAPSVTHKGYDYRLCTNTYFHEVLLTPAMPYPPPPGVLRVRVQLTQAATESMEVQSGGRPVDRVYGPWPVNAFDRQGSAPPLIVDDPAWVGFEPIAGVSTDDPRINWNANDKKHWDSIAPTPGAENLKIDMAPARRLDEFGRMYARQGRFESVGEVGYLLYDASKPWRTVRLLGPDPDGTARILDRLTVYTNTYRQGLVNINTRQTNALTALFFEMPIESHPPPNNISSNLSAAQALELATNTVGANRILGPMVNCSDIAARWTTNYISRFVPSSTYPGDAKFIEDSFVRNSIGLWGIRHNLFTVFVAARVFDKEFEKDPTAYIGSESNHVVGEQRAIAVLWRDPFITTDQYGTKSNENFIRFFHWLVMLFED